MLARMGDGGASIGGTTGETRGQSERWCKDGRTVDALAPAAEEGRSHAAKRVGEGLAPGDPTVSEWGNPADVMVRHPRFRPGGHRGN